jgi:hypothetical protein
LQDKAFLLFNSADTLTKGLGIVFPPIIGLIIGLETPVDIRVAETPLGVLRTDRNNALFLLAATGLAIGVPAALAASFALGPLYGVFAGLGAGLTIGLGVTLGLTAWGKWAVFVRFWMTLTGRAPRALPGFLADAYRLGVLRQEGPFFQFRHARLQDHLAGRTMAERDNALR